MARQAAQMGSKAFLCPGVKKRVRSWHKADDCDCDNADSDGIPDRCKSALEAAEPN